MEVKVTRVERPLPPIKEVTLTLSPWEVDTLRLLSDLRPHIIAALKNLAMEPYCPSMYRFLEGLQTIPRA